MPHKALLKKNDFTVCRAAANFFKVCTFRLQNKAGSLVLAYLLGGWGLGTRLAFTNLKVYLLYWDLMNG